MTGLGFITLRATGERFYLDDGVEKTEPPPITCVVCGETLPHWQFASSRGAGQPVICWGCGRGPTPQWAWGLTFEDQTLICDAKAMLGEISREIAHG